MMHLSQFRSFSDELVKIAIAVQVSPTQKARNAVQAHHEAEKKDWGKFEKELQSKRFQKAVSLSPQSDEKLRAYAENYGAYLNSKKSVGTVPSRSSKDKSYKLKALPGGRLGCDCKDWQYRHSHTGTDCDHIQAFKASGMQKSAGIERDLLTLGSGASFMHRMNKYKKERQHGLVAKDLVRKANGY